MLPKRVVDDVVEDACPLLSTMSTTEPSSSLKYQADVAAGIGLRQNLVDRQSVEIAHLQAARAAEVGVGIGVRAEVPLNTVQVCVPLSSMPIRRPSTSYVYVAAIVP